MNLSELQHKVEQLEKELIDIRTKVSGADGRWWVDRAGRFADDAEFRKIVKLGRAYRKSLRPKAAR